jgi:hypothetical protein
MFALSILGKSRGMINQTASREDLEFMTNSVDCMRYAGLLAYSPKEGFMQKYFDTPDYKKFELATLKVNFQSSYFLKWYYDSNGGSNDSVNR